MSAETDADRPVPDWPCGYGCGWVGTHLRHAIAHEKKCRLGEKTEKTEAARVAITQAERAVVEAAMARDAALGENPYEYDLALADACAALRRVRGK